MKVVGTSRPYGGDANKLVEEAKTHKIAAARVADETREIVFEEPTVVITGVPRGPDWGNWKNEVLLPQYPDRYGAEGRPTATAPPKPAPGDPAALASTRLLTTNPQPRDERDAGIVAEARYPIDGMMLRVEYQQRRTFSQEIKPA